jgi:endonuclease YncB( thermonuclease family)
MKNKHKAGLLKLLLLALTFTVFINANTRLKAENQALSKAVFPLFAFAGQIKVIRVYDGDTIKAITNGNEITIRLVGIDAPEISRKKHLPGQPFCLKSREYLSSLILNKVVRLRFYGKDASGKSLGEVFADEVNINIEMIKAGLAEVYRGTPAKDLEIFAYRDAENKAKADIQGIWELRDQYFSPSDWREMYDIQD